MNIAELIRFNINSRYCEISKPFQMPYYINEECLNLLNCNDLTLLDMMNQNLNLFYRISSKSCDFAGNNISFNTNRIEGLNNLINGVNFKTKLPFNNVAIFKKYHYFLIPVYIISGQIFTDGNHRTAIEYLTNLGYNSPRINLLVNLIDKCIKEKNVRWETVHEFIQKIIDNVACVIDNNNENLLIEKIENLFI